MSEVKHTPTPWALNPKSLDIAGWGGEEVLINEGHGYGFVGALDDANAAFVVRAVNNHDALVAALNAAVFELGRANGFALTPNITEPLRVALESAKGGA